MQPITKHNIFGWLGKGEKRESDHKNSAELLKTNHATQEPKN